MRRDKIPIHSTRVPAHQSVAQEPQHGFVERRRTIEIDHREVDVMDQAAHS